MELKNKVQTETGHINLYPKDWKHLNLGHSAILKARIGWQGLTTAEYLNTGEYYLITGTDFNGGYIDWDNCVYVEKLRFDQDKNIQVKIGDVLVTKDGTIGKVAYVDKLPKNTTLNSGVFVIRPINNSYHPRYFYYVLMSEHFKQFLGKLTAGSTISHLYQKDFVNYDFPLPPTLEEQKAIATALSDVDELISNLDKLITKKKALKQGAMQQLLTPPHKGGKRLEGYTGEWEEKRLGDVIIDFQNGYSFSASGYKDEGIPIVTMAQIGLNGQFQYDENKVNYWSIGELKNLKSFTLYKGDVIMSMTDVTPEKNLIGRMTIVNELGPLYLNQRVGHLRINKNLVNPIILIHLSNMRSWRTYSKSIASLGVQANIGTTDIKNGLLWLPKIEEQNAIAEILSDMDLEIEQLESKKAKYQSVKQGMMQELLTGKTRLV